jgi:hypothetical protein
MSNVEIFFIVSWAASIFILAYAIFNFRCKLENEKNAREIQSEMFWIAIRELEGKVKELEDDVVDLEVKIDKFSS